MKPINPTERFSDRVEDYVKYRPSYPQELLEFLNRKIALKNAHVADVGAGTGIFTKLLLDWGAKVEAVEPNQEMRNSAIAELKDRASFHAGAAENTGIAANSIDLITCAQAFHWFDPAITRTEFQRILKPKGMAALIWNDTNTASPLGKAYDKIKIDFGGENYQNVLKTESKLDEAMQIFFNGPFESHYFAIVQELDLQGLIGRYFSSSYSPKADAPDRKPAEEAVVNAFNKFQSNGIVSLEYVTELFIGWLH